MDTAVKQEQPGIMLAMLREHSARIVAAFILTAIAAGTIFHVALLSYFDQSLFAYWELHDVLIAPFRWSGAFILALVTVIIGVQLACLREQSRQRHPAGLQALHRFLASRRPPITANLVAGLATGVALLLAMTAFVLLVYALAWHEAGKVWYRSHNDVRIELVNDGGHVNGREIATSSEFRFLLADESGFSNRGTKRFIAVPAAQVLAITRCARLAGMNLENRNACEQPDLFSHSATEAERNPAATTPQITAPVQEQAPEPYQRNRLIKEPDF